MIHYIYGTQLTDHPRLATGMFRARARRFGATDRLGWQTDGFDALDPLYVVVSDAGGRHAGSFRLLPTTGPTLLGDLRDPDVWEASRICLAPDAPDMVGRRLLMALSELGLGLGLRACTGVIDGPCATRLLRLGGRSGTDARRGRMRWTFDAARHDALCAAADVTARQSRDWWEVTFGDLASVPLPAGV